MEMTNKFDNERKEVTTKFDEIVERIEELRDLQVDGEMFDETLDDCYEPYMLGNMEFFASDILKSCDPVAYNMAIDEEEDNLKSNLKEEIEEEIEEFKEEFKDNEEEIKELNNLLGDAF
jgi:hypothetical protein